MVRCFTELRGVESLWQSRCCDGVMLGGNMTVLVASAIDGGSGPSTAPCSARHASKLAGSDREAAQRYVAAGAFLAYRRIQKFGRIHRQAACDTAWLSPASVHDRARVRQNAFGGIFRSRSARRSTNGEIGYQISLAPPTTLGQRWRV